MGASSGCEVSLSMSKASQRIARQGTGRKRSSPRATYHRVKLDAQSMILFGPECERERGSSLVGHGVFAAIDG